MGAPQGIEIASASEFREFTSLSGSEAAISDQIFNFPNFQKNYVAVQLGRCKFIFDLIPPFESDVLGLYGKITESSNEFTDFENFEFKRLARPKRSPPCNHPGSVLLKRLPLYESLEMIRGRAAKH